MVGHGGSSAGSYLADPTSPIPSHCAAIVTTSTLRVSIRRFLDWYKQSILTFTEFSGTQWVKSTNLYCRPDNSLLFFVHGLLIV